MVYGENLSRCFKCGKSFICGDCIENECQDCKHGSVINVAERPTQVLVDALMRLPKREPLSMVIRPGRLDRSTPLNELAMAIYDTCEIKGWNEKVDFAEKLLLIHSEISECFEHFRGGLDIADVVHDVKDFKPDGIGIELVDAIIRILHLMAYYGLDIDKLMAMKMEYNAKRPYRHGKKA
jgi:hypothetical protein